MVTVSQLRLELVRDQVFVYPDVMVFHDGFALAEGQPDIVTNPSVVVEVLSESTEAWDRGGKFGLYQGVATLQEYVLVSTTAMRAEWFTREEDGRWSYRKAEGPEGVRLETLGVPLGVGRIYRKVSDTEIPCFVAHCSVRTRHLRESAIGLVEEISDELRRLLNRDEVIYALMSKELGRAGSALAGIESALLATGTDPAELGAVIKKMRKNMSAVVASLDPSIADGVKVGIEAYVAAARSLLPAIIRKSFIDGMSKNFDLWERVEQYGRFCWQAVAADEPLVLGDTIVIFETSGKLRFKPFADGSDDVRVIYLPLSSDRLLVGSLRRSAPEIDGACLNEAISRCSFEFFVSSRELPLASNLIPDIGRWSGLLNRKVSSRIVRDLERSFLAG